MRVDGKIDRKVLAVPEKALSESTHTYVAPATPIEKTIAGIWTELLAVRKIGVHDDFFDSGGHSLLATRLVSQIRRTFDVELPLRAVFESPTIAAISELVQAIMWAATTIQPDLSIGEREEMVL